MRGGAARSGEERRGAMGAGHEWELAAASPPSADRCRRLVCVCGRPLESVRAWRPTWKRSKGLLWMSHLGRSHTHTHKHAHAQSWLRARIRFAPAAQSHYFDWNLCGTSSRKNPDPSVHWCLTGTGSMSQVFNKLFGWIIFTQNVFQVLRPAGGCDSTTPKDLLHTLFANPFNYQSGNWVFSPSSHQFEHRKVMRICTWPPAFSCRCSSTVTTNAE